MSEVTGSVTFGSTGDTTISLPFTPTTVVAVTGGLYNTNETSNARQGDGAADANYQYATATLVNSSGYFTRTYNGSQLFAILDGTSGNELVLGKLKSFGTNSATFTITNASTLAQVFLTFRS